MHDWNGLNWQDFNNRYYMPEIGRFTGVDPIASQYPHVSVYNYAENEPIRHVDLWGLQKALPNIYGPAHYQGNANLRYLGFALWNPNATARIGYYQRGSNNISTTAVRFATTGEVLNGSKPNPFDKDADMGSENGAMRHVLWQATITKEYGESTALQAGNAHEDDAMRDLSKNKFENRKEMDETVDLLNNQIGRKIGAENPGKDFLEMANIVLDEYHDNGFYTATRTRDNKYTTSKNRLSDEKYNKLKKLYENLNVSGRSNKKAKG